MQKLIKLHHSVTELGNIQVRQVVDKKHGKKILSAIFSGLFLIFSAFSYAGDIAKIKSFHHSVTELGNLQLRIITEYTKNGEVKDKKYSNPVTPADPNNIKDWDTRSQDIVSAIVTPEVKTAFEAEKQIPTGIGSEEIVTYDRVIENDGKIAVRRITRIFDNGVEVNKRYHRGWIMPGDDPSKADVISKALAKKLHTPKVIADYKAAELARQTKNR